MSFIGRATELVLPEESAALTPELSTLTSEQSYSAFVELNEPVVISELSQIASDELTRLQKLAEPVASRERVSPDLVQQTVLILCSGRYLGLRVLAQLLGRNPDGVDLRKRILNPLVASKNLQRAYPNPNDPRQAYTTSNVAGSRPAPG